MKGFLSVILVIALLGLVIGKLMPHQRDDDAPAKPVPVAAAPAQPAPVAQQAPKKFSEMTPAEKIESWATRIEASGTGTCRYIAERVRELGQQGALPGNEAFSPWLDRAQQQGCNMKSN